MTAREPSPWRATRLLFQAFKAAILGRFSLKRLLGAVLRLGRNLTEPPRQRRPQLS